MVTMLVKVKSSRNQVKDIGDTVLNLIIRLPVYTKK